MMVPIATIVVTLLFCFLSFCFGAKMATKTVLDKIEEVLGKEEAKILYRKLYRTL